MQAVMETLMKKHAAKRALAQPDVAAVPLGAPSVVDPGIPDIDDDLPDLSDRGDSDDDEAGATTERVAKKARIFGQKSPATHRVQQYGPGVFEVRGDVMWCCACQKPVGECHVFSPGSGPPC